LDGALATELERRGANLNDPLWSARCLIEQPGMIRAVHSDYFRAGADIATSATYQATFQGFERRGIGPAGAEQLMRGAVRLAIDARDEFWADESNRAARLRPLVAASIGPYGAMLADGSEYRGRYAISDRALRDFHRPRLLALAQSGADLLACETLPGLREALILVELLEECPGVCAWVSFSCQDGSRTCEGDDIADCAISLDAAAQVAAIGVNCTRPQHVDSLLRRMRARTAKPLAAYPNSGEEYDAGSKVWSGRTDARPFAAYSRAWVEAGARLIGGCCRSTPQDIGMIRAALGRAVPQCSEK
jgi:homocysteine S-methyltransferase